jgi:hypothetical protein
MPQTLNKPIHTDQSIIHFLCAGSKQDELAVGRDRMHTISGGGGLLLFVLGGNPRGSMTTSGPYPFPTSFTVNSVLLRNSLIDNNIK